MLSNRKGAIELIYLMMIVCVFSISISGFYNYYNNVTKINSINSNNHNSNNDINSLSSLIAKNIENNTYNSFTNYNQYDINIKKLTSNTMQQNYVNGVLEPRYIEKDYTNSHIINLNDTTKLDRDSTHNYFLFSNSSNGINVSYDQNSTNIKYNLAEKSNTYYYGIESTDSTATTLYFTPVNSSTTDYNVIYYYEFANTPEDYNFYVAKITKNEEVIYNIYVESKSFVKEIYSYKK